MSLVFFKYLEGKRRRAKLFQITVFALTRGTLIGLLGAGAAPVFASEVRFERGARRVSDRTFRTAQALFLANTRVMPREGRADPFLPADRLAALAC